MYRGGTERMDSDQSFFTWRFPFETRRTEAISYILYFATQMKQKYNIK